MRLALAIFAAGATLGVTSRAPAGETRAAAGALEQLAQQTLTALGPLPANAIVVVAPLASDQPLPKAEELAVRVASLVAGRMGGASRSHGQPAQLAGARALAGKTGGLVYLQLELAKGDLRATADVFPAVSNGWDRIRNPLPPPTAHGFATVRVDAEVRAFLPPILLEQASVHKSKHDEGEVLAVACGDMDGDGGNEIALVSRGRIALGRLRAGRFVASRTVAWSAVASRAPSPMREPIGTAAFARTSDGMALFAGTTDRGGVVLGADLAKLDAFGALPVAVGDGIGCAAPHAGVSAFEGQLVECAASRGGAAVLVPPASRFDAFASTLLATRGGGARLVSAAREPGGKLRVRFGDDPAQTRLMDGVGAQVAVGDLDQDGIAEIVTTQETGADEIFVNSWTGADPRLRLRLPAPAGVRALGVCPPEERAAPALIAVVGGEIWIVR